MTNVPLFKVFMTPEAADAARDTLNSGWIGQGGKVKEFEKILSKYLNYSHIVTLNSATSGLQLGLRLAGVRPGDSIISTPLTCFATNVPALASYADIHWADTDISTCNIDIDDVVSKVKPDTAAIMFVHWGGVPVDIDSLRDRVANKLGFCPPLIEDCAHAMGATYRGGQKKVGSSGNFCSFSFQAIKHLTTGDGGMLTMPGGYQPRAKLLRWYGIDREGDTSKKKDFRSDLPVDEWGYKFHMNDINATIGIHNFKRLEDTVLKAHRDNAEYYNQELADIDGIQLFEIPAGSNPSYWLYTIKVDHRDDFVTKLKGRGIMTSKVHERNDKHPCLSRFQVDLPKLTSMEDQYLCIPVGWWVTPENREYIVNTIKEGW